MWDEGEKIKALTDLGGGKYGINAGYDDYEGEEGKTGKDDPLDFNGHGTHCAGIIAAEWNGFGISGAANGVRIMAVKHEINIEGISYISSTLRGFHYIRTAKDNGVNVAAVNCSYGGPSCSLAELYGITELCKDDIVVCVASSNKNTNNDILPYYPCGLTDLPQLIAVNSMDCNGRQSDFSNYGKRSTHLFSPGTHIISTYPNSLKEMYTDKDISRPVKDSSGNTIYDSFDSNDPSKNYFDYETSAFSNIEFKDGELKFSETV